MANSGVSTLTVDWPDTPKRPERPELEAWEPRLETELRLRSIILLISTGSIRYAISKGLFFCANIVTSAMENGDSPAGSSKCRADSR